MASKEKRQFKGGKADMRLSYFFILILVVRLFWMRNICARESTLKKRSKNTFYKFFAAANINKKELFREFLRG